MTTTPARYQPARDTAAQWAASTRVLLAGELGYETDTGNAKIGNGTATWATLPYLGTGGGGGGGGATGGDAAAPYGRVFLDSFTGTNDDAKLSAALTAVAADTYPRTIQLTNRAYSFSGTHAAFDGLRIEGAAGYGNPERRSGTKTPSAITLTGTGAWFTNPANTTVYSVSFHSLTFVGGANATVVGQNGTSGSWYCLSMRDIYASGLKSVAGTATAKLLITAATFSGDWEVNNCTGTAFHLGGSDSTLWANGMLLDSAVANNPAAGTPHLWLDQVEKSYIGPIYVTAEGPWGGVVIEGPAFNSTANNQGGSLVIEGAKIEGRNAGAPCYGAPVRVNGGIVILRDCWLSYGMSSPAGSARTPVDSGVVHHEAGQLLVSGGTYDRATAVAEAVPWVYTNSNADCIVSNTFRASKGGTWTGRPRFARPTGATENRINDATTTLVSV